MRGQVLNYFVISHLHTKAFLCLVNPTQETKPLQRLVLDSSLWKILSISPVRTDQPAPRTINSLADLTGNIILVDNTHFVHIGLLIQCCFLVDTSKLSEYTFCTHWIKLIQRFFHLMPQSSVNTHVVHIGLNSSNVVFSISPIRVNHPAPLSRSDWEYHFRC